MLKIPPHSMEAEQSVLWSLLIDKDWFLVISDLLTKEDFYDDKNAKIYEIMQELYTKSKPIDIITVKDRLQDRWYLDDIWGLNYIVELTEIVPTSSNIYEYAQIVKNKAVNRKLIKTWNEIILNGYNEEKNINELLEASEKSLFAVTQVFIKNKLVHLKDILDSRFEEFAEVHENPESVKSHRLYTWFKN